MKLIYFVESYIAGGSDKIAQILLGNLNFSEIILIINKRADKKIILNKLNNNIRVKYYNLITQLKFMKK